MSGLIIAGSIAAAGAIGGGALAAHAAGSAAKTQANAADQAAQLQYQASQNALDFTKQQYGTSQQEMMPWLQSGQQGLANLNYMMGLNPGNIQAYSPNTTSMPASAGVYNPSVGMGGAMSGGIQGGQGIVSPGMRPQPMGVSAGMAGIPSSSGITGAAGMTPSSGAVQAFGGGIGQYNPATGQAGQVTPPAGNTLGSQVNPSIGGYGSLMQPFGETFQAPSGLTEQNDPGYQARLKLGTDAIQRSAAARGNVLTGGTAKALDTYGQDYGSNEYANVYNRALTDYTTRYNAYNQNQTNQYNRLASMAGVGQTAGTQLANLGQNASQQVGNNLLQTAQNMGQQYNNAAAANASGMVGSANAWGGALGSLGNTANNLYQMNQLKQMQDNYNYANWANNYDPYAG